MKCTNCGKTVPNSAKICGYCGHPLKKVEAVPVEAPVTPRQNSHTRAGGMKGWVIGAFGLSVVLAVALIILLTRTRPQVPVEQPSENSNISPIQESTIESVSEPVDSNVLLYDDFKDPNSGWPVFQDGNNAQAGYADGAYRIAFLKTDNFQAAWSAKEYDNFIVETTFSVPLGETGIGAGLTLRAEDKSWYMVWIFPNTQDFILVRSVNNEPNPLIPRQRFELFQPQLKDNRLYIQLKVVANPNGFEVWAAQPGQTYQMLGTVNDSTLTSGHLGPSANSTLPLVNSPAEVLFDWIKVSRITPAE